MSLGIKWHSLIKTLRCGENKLGLLIFALKSPIINMFVDSKESLIAWILPKLARYSSMLSSH